MTGTLPECAEATMGLSPLDLVDLGSKHEPQAASMKLNIQFRDCEAKLLVVRDGLRLIQHIIFLKIV